MLLTFTQSCEDLGIYEEGVKALKAEFLSEYYLCIMHG